MKKMLITLGILMVSGVAVVLIAQAEQEVVPGWEEQSTHVQGSGEFIGGDTPEEIQKRIEAAEERVLSPEGQAELRARSGGK